MFWTSVDWKAMSAHMLCWVQWNVSIHSIRHCTVFMTILCPWCKCCNKSRATINDKEDRVRFISNFSHWHGQCKQCHQNCQPAGLTPCYAAEVAFFLNTVFTSLNNFLYLSRTSSGKRKLDVRCRNWAGNMWKCLRCNFNSSEEFVHTIYKSLHGCRGVFLR